MIINVTKNILSYNFFDVNKGYSLGKSFLLDIWLEFSIDLIGK
ncbi:hypothetical protein DU18_0805 [Chlamydia muridarum]|nr:hypothetical protein DU18_0805 [Chlamydia muridarum]KDU83708.1 hypothetical protein DU20_0805 [Chlamydia muridarum]